MKTKAVFFDLDGTLLPMDQDLFIKEYFGRMAASIARHGYEPRKLIDVILKGTGIMIGNDGSRTNEQALWDYFCSVYGEEARADMRLFELFYEQEFDEARACCGRDERAAQVIARVKERGLRAILATNPLFPPVATLKRIGWAGLRAQDFDLITTYDNSRFCKPNPRYFEDILSALGLRAEECVMVGNDTSDDLSAAQLGMPVFILTDCLINAKGVDLSSLPHGSFEQLFDWINALE